MSIFPVDASKRQVIRTFQLLGFLIIREGEHMSWCERIRMARRLR